MGRLWISSNDFHHKNNVDIVSYTETNINWNAEHTIAAKTNMKPYFNHSIIATSNSNDHTESYHQQGVTCTIVTNNLTGRVVKDISDDSGLGRWSGQRLKRDNKNHVSIITAYCPHTDSKHGSNTCYQQQFRLLSQQGIINPEPRQQMFKDLQKLIEKLQNDSDAIILQWDVNNIPTSEEVSNITSSLNLYHLMPNTDKLFSTYN